jgi:hypothetical protein
LVLGLLLIAKKKKFGDFKAWIAFLLALVLGYFSSPIGLIGLAILSTMPQKSAPVPPPNTSQVPTPPIA